MLPGTSTLNNLRILAAPFAVAIMVALLPVTAFGADQGTTSARPVQDVLNKRCVVCHGCYDAPCQLKLSSPEGWLRGASKQKVYDSSRLEDAPMTRLGVDAAMPDWREKGFLM